MNRDLQLKNKRKKIIKLAIDNPKLAINQINDEVQALSNCNTKMDLIFALSQFFCISESTVEKDYYGC